MGKRADGLAHRLQRIIAVTSAGLVVHQPRPITLTSRNDVLNHLAENRNDNSGSFCGVGSDLLPRQYQSLLESMNQAANPFNALYAA